MKISKTIFLDRDGVINVDKEYVYKIEDFEFQASIFDLLQRVQELGYQLFIVTNQSGIGRGYYSENDFQRLTEWMIKEFEKQNIFIKKVYHCPHLSQDNCECRKPKSGMLKQAAKEFEIDPENSWLIGDKQRDIQAGKNFGIENTILVSSECNKKTDAKFCVKSILDIINIITK